MTVCHPHFSRNIVFAGQELGEGGEMAPFLSYHGPWLSLPI